MFSWLYKKAVAWKWDILMTVALILVGIFLCRGALGQEMVMGLDYAGHYVKVKFLAEELIPLGKIDGWFPYWHLGFQLFQFYPPGFYLFTGTINFLSLGMLELQTSFNIAAALSFALVSASVFLMMRMLGYSREGSLAAGMMALFVGSWYGGGIVGTFRTGLVPNSFGLMLVPLAIGLFYRALETKKQREVLLAGLALGFIVLSHVLSAMLAIALSLLLFGIYCAKERKLGKNALVLLKVIGIAAVLSAWWWVPAAAKYQEHGYLGQWSSPGMSELFAGILNGSAIGSVLVPALCIAGIAVTAYRRRFADFFIAVAVVLLFLATSGILKLGASEQDLFGSTHYARLLGALAIFMTAGAGIVFDFLTSIAGRVGKRERIAKAGIVCAAIALVVVFHWQAFAWQNIPTEKDFSAIAGVRNAAAWLEKNTTREEVIANEFSWQEWKKYGSPHILDQYIPALAHRKVIGGNFSEGAKSTLSILFVPEQFGNTGAGIHSRLRSLGATVVVTYSEGSGQAFEKNSLYEKVFQDSGVRIFRIRGAGLIPEAENATLLSYTEENERISFSIEATADSTITVPVNYYPNWSARVNGEIAVLERNSDNLIQIRVEKGLNEIELEFRPFWWETMLFLVSLALFIAVTALLAGVSPETFKKFRSSK